MAYSTALATKRKWLIACCAIAGFAPVQGQSNERKPMTAAAEIAYRVNVRDEKAAAEATVKPDGSLQISVHLALSGEESNWTAQLDRPTLIQFRDVVSELKKTAPSVEPKPTFLVLSPGAVRTAAWNVGRETPEQARLREAMESVLHIRYAISRAYLKLAAAGENAHNLALAGHAAKAGIEELGESYMDPDALDDTGMKLIQARSTEKNAGIEGAAPAYQRVLAARLEMYARRRNLPWP